METIKNIAPKRILGATSKIYESGNSGPSTVSTGRGDHGGVSYGTYQFSSRDGYNSSVAKFVNQCSFANEFSGLFPGSQSFSDKWREICSRYLDKFGYEQHVYIKERYYDSAINKLRRLGLLEGTFSFGVRELIWSTAVQFGPAGCYNIFQRAGINSTTSNKDIINKVYNEKSKVRSYFASSSSNVQENILKRYESERLKNLQDCA